LYLNYIIILRINLRVFTTSLCLYITSEIMKYHGFQGDFNESD